MSPYLDNHSQYDAPTTKRIVRWEEPAIGCLNDSKRNEPEQSPGFGFVDNTTGSSDWETAARKENVGVSSSARLSTESHQSKVREHSDDEGINLLEPTSEHIADLSSDSREPSSSAEPPSSKWPTETTANLNDQLPGSIE